jgi:tetratricopeptide (TPR) repeat protein
MVAVLNNQFACLSRFSIAALVALTLVSCASTGSLRTAHDAELSQNYDIAVAEYGKLLRKNPNSREARQGLERAKLRASQDHFTKARRLATTGKLDEALIEYQLAAELNPGNAEVDRELQETRSQLRAQVAVREDGKTRLESLIAQSLAAPLPGSDSRRMRSYPTRWCFVTPARGTSTPRSASSRT